MDNKCPFAAPLTQPGYHCHYADEVIRRGGSEFNCLAADRHAHCVHLHTRLKAAALPVFEVEDDLLSMPHSVLVKIQFGGLLGIQRLLGNDDRGIADITTLIETAERSYSGIENIPCSDVTGDMQSFKVARRRSR